ncbi:MAG: hypothetical protein KGZ49_13290 [Syntrophaceae bacterium]|nr:hypothetical protein [Syntrophaceae bacterium]
MKLKNIIHSLVVVLILLFGIESSFSQSISEEALRHFNRGLAAVEIAKSPEDYEPAIREFQEAARLAPYWADPYYNLGVVQEKMARFDDAIKNLKRYMQLNPNAVDAQEVKNLMSKIEYKNEKANEYQNIIKKLTAPGKLIVISGDPEMMWPRSFRLRDGKLEGSIYHYQQHNAGREWIPVALDGRKLEYNFVWYQCPLTLDPNGCPFRVSVKSEIVSTEPLRLKSKSVWSQQFGRRVIVEYENLKEKVDNR